MKNFRLLTLILGTAAVLASCTSGTDNGDTNVEKSGDKQALHGSQGNPAGDSATAGMRRAPDSQVSGKEQFEKADQTVDRNKDGLAD